MNSTDSGRDPFEQLAEDFVARYRVGERPSVSEYAQRHPELADKIQELFPALVVMEELRPGKGGPSAAGAQSERAVPRQLGEYRILREIGRGGMGVVYEAVQESLGRHVALKALPLKGLLDSTYLERFRREAQAAARLHHTNIVPVFGVGEHAGVHFFAMQFIQGQGLDVVLEEVKRLRNGPEPTGPGGAAERPAASSAAQRLLSDHFPGRPAEGLPTGPAPAAPATTTTAVAQSSTWVSRSRSEAQYCRSVARVGVQVAEALAYAHDHGVLHRDIKPSNLLLDVHGTVWVTDFGLAKVVGADDLTGPGDMVGTLRFMAPERIQGRSDPQGDVYSLGLTLYELLTLRPAFADADRVRLMRRVASEEPPRPRQLNPFTPHDLETVILKATAKDPARRYPNAGALAEDLGRFLSGQPIRARRARPWERLRKWAKRQPALAGLLAVIGLAALSLLAGVLYHNAQLRAKVHEVEEQQGKARREAERAEAHFTLALSAVENYFTQVSESSKLKAHGLEGLRRELLLLAREFYQKFIEDRRGDPDLQAELGRAYMRLGFITDVLGSKQEALGLYQQAVDIFEHLTRDRPDAPALQDSLAFSLNSLGLLYDALGRSKEAETTYQQAAFLFDHLGRGDPQSPKYQNALARIHGNLAALYRDTDRIKEAEPAFARTRAIFQGLVHRYPDVPEYQRSLAISFYNWGDLCRETGRLQEAEQAHQQGLELWQQLTRKHPEIPESQAELADAYVGLGNVYVAAERFPDAEAAYREALVIGQRLTRQHPEVPEYEMKLASSHGNLGHVYWRTGRTNEAEEAFRQTRAIHERLAHKHPEVLKHQRELAITYGNLGVFYRNTGRSKEAEAAYGQARALFEDLAHKHPEVLDFVIFLGNVETNLGNLPLVDEKPLEALEWYAKAIPRLEAALQKEVRHLKAREFLRNAYYGRAEALTNLGRHREALPARDRAIELDDQNNPTFRIGRITTLARLGEHAQAVAEAEGLASKADADGLFNLACAYALSSAAASGDANLVELHASRAVELLRQSIKKGYKDVDSLKQKQDLDPLRSRADFQELVRTLAEPTKPQ